MRRKDKELLELAAKAASLKYTTANHIDYLLISVDDGNRVVPWSPLTSDADALRLAVKLGLDIGLDPATNITSEYCNIMNEFLFERHGNDPYAACRRAIVRAAAEIGETL